MARIMPMPLYTSEVSDGTTIAIVERTPTPDEYRRLRVSVGWNELRPDATSGPA